MQHDDLVYAGTMLDSALRIRRRATDLTRETFDGNEDVQLALTHLIQVVGEAASHTSLAFQEAHSEIPWSKVIGMSHRIVHNYDDVNADIVWDVATAQLEPLVAALRRIVPEPPGGWEGKSWVAENFDEPLPPEILNGFGGGPET